MSRTGRWRTTCCGGRRRSSACGATWATTAESAVRTVTQGRVNITTNPAIRQTFYGDCTQCHTQVHGSNVPSPTDPNANAKFR